MLNEQRLIVSRNRPTVICASARATFQARHQTLPAKRPGSGAVDSAATLARAARHPCKYECGVAFRLMLSSILGQTQQDENDNFGGLMAGPGAAWGAA